MMYAPHTLYKKLSGGFGVDALGKPVQKAEAWEKVCMCRCDDSNTQELQSENGQTYKSRYHVVYDRTDAIEEGDEIMCIDADGNTRGGGVVGMVKSTNYLNYSELWT